MVTQRPAPAGAMPHSLRAQDLPSKHAAIARRPRALVPTSPCFGPSVPLQADTAALRSRPRSVVPPIATSASAPILTSSASEFIPPSLMGHHCYDNAVPESAFRTIKEEGIGQTAPATITEAREKLLSFIEGFYNTKLLHSTPGYRTPNEVEKDMSVKTNLDSRSRNK